MHERARKQFKRVTFVHAGVAVLQHGELVDLAELFEQRFEVLLLEVARYLAHEELDCVLVLHGAAVGVDHGARLGAAHGLGEHEVRVLRARG